MTSQYNLISRMRKLFQGLFSITKCRRAIVWILLCVTCGCSEFGPSYRISPKERIVNEIMAKTIIQLKQQYGLQPFGDGAQMMDEVWMLALSFIYDKPIDVDGGRVLLVHAVEEFLSQINKDERIRPYLGRYPFVPKNVEIMIVFRNPDHSTIASEKLQLCVARDGICRYKCGGSTPQDPVIIMHEESFAEAHWKAHSLELDPNVHQETGTPL